jgi:hypothetical protein
MTTPATPPAAPVPWYVRPQIVLPVIAALVVLAALSTPDVLSGRSGDSRLSISSPQPQGAQLFAELAQRMGWQVQGQQVLGVPDEPNTIFAELSPARPLRMTEAHAALEYVRAGGALLLIMPSGGGLADSLHLAILDNGRGGLVIPLAGGAPADCAPHADFFIPLWPANQATMFGLRWTAPRPDSAITLLQVSIRVDSATEREYPAMVGFPLGRGRVVVGSDPDLLRNDVLRACGNSTDLAAVNVLEYLRNGGAAPRRTSVFVEYHQGFGAQPGTIRAIGTFLSGTAPGRSLFQLLAAGLVLLFALAPRAIAPRDAERIERRSPLEHVDALARAYAQVGASRTATARLIRGVRRRIDVGDARAGAGLSDDAFLARAEQNKPAVRPDVALIRKALTDRVARADFALVGDAVYRLESTLTRT